MSPQTFTIKIYNEGPLCAIPIPFDPKAVFGKVRAPVKVTLNGYTYRSTITAMAGTLWIPLRKSHREAAGLAGDETLIVKIELDTEAREVRMPDDLEEALRANPVALEAWQALSYTFKREYVETLEGAKKAETRARRLTGILAALQKAKA
ncbi:MAG: hypothetical protein JWO94_3914 [Verrucomicrobiaceae bacterium]|nr:hypothetical protein [Verrucomicrobiaceae bacterium]